MQELPEILSKMEKVTILVLLVNLVLIQGKTAVVPDEALRAADNRIHLGVYASAIAKAHFNPWYCNYFKEPGYKCTDCRTALHCFPGNFALLIQCNGRNQYCDNGYCSETTSARCDIPSQDKLPQWGSVSENIRPAKPEKPTLKEDKTTEENIKGVRRSF